MVRLGGLDFVQNVVRPVLQYYAVDPAKACGTAVIIAPGGGSVNLTIRYEGTDVARRLNEAGVAAFILKYRLIRHDPATARPDPKDDRGFVLSGPQKGQNIWELEDRDGREAVQWLPAARRRVRLQPSPASNRVCGLLRRRTVSPSPPSPDPGKAGRTSSGSFTARAKWQAEARSRWAADVFGRCGGRRVEHRRFDPAFRFMARRQAAGRDPHLSNGRSCFPQKRRGRRPWSSDRFVEWLQCNGLLARPSS